MLSCKIESKSFGTLECYSDKLKGFLRYDTKFDWLGDTAEITANHYASSRAFSVRLIRLPSWSRRITYLED